MERSKRQETRQRQKTNNRWMIPGFICKLSTMIHTIEFSNDNVYFQYLEHLTLMQSYSQELREVEFYRQQRSQPFCKLCCRRYDDDQEFKKHLQIVHFDIHILPYLKEFEFGIDQIVDDHSLQLEFDLQEIEEQYEQEQEQLIFENSEQQQLQQFQQLHDQIRLVEINGQYYNATLSNRCKATFIRTRKYLSKVFRIDTIVNMAALSFITVIIWAVQQTKIDNGCMKQQWEQCPVGQYLLANLHQFILQYSIGTIMYQMILNCQQLPFRIGFECIMQFIIVLIISVATAMKSIHEINKVVVIVYLVIAIILLVIFKLIIGHKMIVQVLKLSQTVFLLALCIILKTTLNSVQNMGSTYNLIVIQYLVAIIKVYLFHMIRQRIKNKQYYDDILIISTMVYASDYALVVRLLVIEELSIARQIVLIVNFVILQMQTILNFNLFYWLLRKYVLHVAILPLPVYLDQLARTIWSLSYECLLTYPIVIAIKAVVSVIQRVLRRDRQEAQGLLEYTISENGYLETRIELDQVTQLSCQQQLVSYFLFLIAQLLRIMVELIDSDQIKNKQYWIIQQADRQKHNQATLSNIMIVNGIISLIVLILVLLKCRKQVAVLKWEILAQNIFQRILLWMAFLISCNKVIYE